MDKDTQAHLQANTVRLNDRTLWFDGDSSFEAVKLLNHIRRYHVKYVDQITPEVKEYNRNVSRSDEIQIKQQCRPLDLSWNIPDEYKQMDIVSYICDRHIALTADMSPDEAELRDRRLLTELKAYKKYGLDDVIRAIIWLINNLTANNVIWGVGRGSSVASYVLYVIGVHDVDSYAYQLDINDFLHE